MPIKLDDYLVNSDTALVLDGEEKLADTDLAQLRHFSKSRRGAITSVVLSHTNISGECFQYLALLPNLRALYAYNTQLDDNTPIELLPRTLKILNLDCTKVGDRCVFKLIKFPRLSELYLRNTCITRRGDRFLVKLARSSRKDTDRISAYQHAYERQAMGDAGSRLKLGGAIKRLALALFWVRQPPDYGLRRLFRINST